MFCLKVENKRLGFSTAQAHAVPGEQVVESENVRVKFIGDKLYSFYLRLPTTVIAGESLAPVAEVELRRIFERLVQKNESSFSSEKVSTYVAVEIETGKIRAFRNISCNRPLYFRRDKGVFILSSHLAPFKREGIKLELREEAIPELLVYRHITPPATICRSIDSVPGGFGLTFDPDKDCVSYKNLWQLERANHGVTVKDAVDVTSELLRRSLWIPKETGRKTSLLLSGGLDSTLLGAFAREIGMHLDSISSGFHLITGDAGESHYARSAADWLGINHRIHDVSEEDYLLQLVDSVYDAEEPVHHLQSVILGSLFSKAVGHDVTYLINGDGADLLFGTAMHLRHLKSQRIVRFTDKKAVRSLAAPIFSALGRNSEKFRYLLYDHSDDHRDPNHFIWTLEAFGDIDWVRDFAGGDIAKIIEGRSSFLDNFGGWPIIDKMTVLFYCSDIDHSMKVWGKLAERDNHILLFPFSYPELIIYLLNLSWRIKGREPKYLLRAVAGAMKLSRHIIDRPKKSFGFDVKHWALQGTLFQPLVEMAGEMYDEKVLRSLQFGEPGKAMVLWGMINVYLWHRLFVQETPATAIKEEIVSRRKSQRKSRP
jgi:predicted subunit of tRNA(5-methylaminomethyl-2-thiouridylate) methyltransferase